MTEQKLGPPPVEGLSDVAWARVERNVFTRMEGTVTNAVAAREVRGERKNPWFWLAVPGAAAAAFALAFFSMKAPEQHAGAGSAEPSRVVSGASPTSVQFGDAHVTLDANSAVLMDQKEAKPIALLENGAATFAVAPRGDRGAFTIMAGDASIRTSNGELHVAREGERVEVSVETGSVEVRFHGHEIPVGAHHTWSSDRPSDVK